MVRERTNFHCVLCYKPAFSRGNTESRKTEDSKFIHLFSRYLKVPLKPQHEDVIPDFLCCEDCSILANSFSQFYSQLECIRLQVSWKVSQIFDTMRSAGRVPSRIIGFREQFEEDRDGGRKVFNNIRRLRTCLVKRCKMKLKSSQPRVQLRRAFKDCKEIKTETLSNSDQEKLAFSENELLAALMITYLAVLYLGFPIVNLILKHDSSQECEINLKGNFEENAQVPMKLEPECQEPDLTHYAHYPEREEEEKENVEVNDAQEIQEDEMEIGEVNIKSEEIQVQGEGDGENEWTPSIMNVTGAQNQHKTTAVLPKEVASSSLSLRALFRCDKCSKTFPNQIRMDVHMNSHDKMATISPPSPPTRKSLRALLKCSGCTRTFCNQARLDAHMKAHDEELEDSDSYCGSPQGNCDADVEFQMDVDEPDEEDCFNEEEGLEITKDQDTDDDYELINEEDESKTASGGETELIGEDNGSNTESGGETKLIREENESETESEAKNDAEIITDHDKLKCELCHKILDSKWMLYTHTCSYKLQSEVVSGELQCSKCGKLCKSKEDLELHHQSTHISRLTCRYVCADEKQNDETSSSKTANNPPPVTDAAIEVEMIQTSPPQTNSKDPKASDLDPTSINLPMFTLIEKLIEKQLGDGKQDKNPDIPCELCFQKFMTKSELDTHKHTEHNVPNEPLQNVCGWCRKSFQTVHLLEHHYDLAHAFPEPHHNSFKARVNCEECRTLLECEAALEKHRILVHRRLGSFVMCHSCSSMFSCHAELLRHRTNKSHPCYSDNSEDLVPAAAPRFPFETEVRGNKFCPVEGCYEVFSLGTWLDIHLKTHGKWVCVKCPQEFSKAHDLACHELREHHDKQGLTNKCTRCTASFDTTRALVAHFLEIHLYTT